MGEVIPLPFARAIRAAAVSGGRSSRPRVLYDPTCPFCYVGVELAARVLPRADWIPVAATTPADGAAFRARAQEVADTVAIPLVWPPRFPGAAPGALRAGALAQERRAGAGFALAAVRLAFCGGYDLDEPAVVAEAAAAAGLDPQLALEAAEDEGRDLALLLTAAALTERGVRRLPALRIGERWFAGLDALARLEPALARVSVRARGE